MQGTALLACAGRGADWAEKDRAETQVKRLVNPLPSCTSLFFLCSSSGLFFHIRHDGRPLGPDGTLSAGASVARRLLLTLRQVLVGQRCDSCNLEERKADFLNFFLLLTASVRQLKMII